MNRFVKPLCELNGVSGDEGALRKYILSNIGDNPYKIDNLGNIIVDKKGRKTPKNKIMISAHMDEVGFIVTGITDDGYIKFAPVGGVDARVIFSKRVRIGEKVGVVCVVPIHLTDKDKKRDIPKIKDMYIDIGASDKKQAQQFVSPGDSVYFENDFVCYGEGFVRAKALDDRFGCAVMLEMINGEIEYDTTFTFVVQEEVGLVGATAAAYTVSPDIAIVLESTTANDVADVEGLDKVCSLSEGAVISFMDSRTVYDKLLYDTAVKTAQENNIPWQTKTRIAGGNDAGAIQVAGSGCKVIAVSLPSRYLHSAGCVGHIDDMESIEKLIPKLIEAFAELDL